MFTPLSSDWVQQIASSYFRMVQYLTIKVAQGEINDDMDFDIYEHFMTKENVYPSRNPLIFPKGDIDMVDYPPNIDFKALAWIDKATDNVVASLIVFSDWSELNGRKLVVEALDAIQKLSSARVAFVDSSKMGCNEYFEFQQLDMNDFSRMKSFVQGLKACSDFDRKSANDATLFEKLQAFMSLSVVSHGQTGFIVNGRVQIVNLY